ncbi:hypothetical protein P152DRAFT_461941 [Eremomyces bilateralis CBS 781.70]|uniref:C2H2-type domain-containing protein n=1 Tax=Eremomyces bilateralis CBS 781.70 TaxID=1392243 RepID=A0A6G1FTR7_9PEZI|nr:uncharacterized protein P152DRAFT_461941 [Eremomyces bilateralis CBS 781.70]KAF1809082.1 hypothetical protein P152DRAFT_461941 [Eremomyces bilateralis CBS 781.70]
MGKKKRNHPDVEDVLSRPWCYYCERDFDDLKILISHQKAKHFKCDRCNRRLNTAGGLSVHLNQVHKETLNAVDNALPNRQGLDVEIFGMEGIPEDVVNSHKQRVLQQYYEAQADRQAQTGNPAPGANAPKKPKFESPSDLKRRLAEHKAKKAAEAAGSSGDVTPLQGAQSPAAATQSPVPFHPPFPSHQVPHIPPQTSPPPYGQFPPYGQQAFPPSWVPGMPQVPPMPGGYSPGQYPSISPPFQGHPQVLRQNLPNAPGLPQRPAFGAPQVNSFQFQQMHQGHAQPSSPGPNQTQGVNGHNAAAFSASVDELIASTKQEMDKSKPSATEKSKKDFRLVYSDNEVSPEEKMATLPRYAFVPNNKPETVLGDVEGSVTGPVVGPDDVMDKSG